MPAEICNSIANGVFFCLFRQYQFLSQYGEKHFWAMYGKITCHILVSTKFVVWWNGWRLSIRIYRNGRAQKSQSLQWQWHVPKTVGRWNHVSSSAYTKRNGDKSANFVHSMSEAIINRFRDGISILINHTKQHEEKAKEVLIYCQAMDSDSVLFLTLKCSLDLRAYPHLTPDSSHLLVEMYHKWCYYVNTNHLK